MKLRVCAVAGMVFAGMVLSGNGLFAYGLEYGTQMGGGGGFPSVWREAFGSRDEARAAAVAELIEHLGHGSDKRQAELLRKVKQNGTQRTFFSSMTRQEGAFRCS